VDYAGYTATDSAAITSFAGSLLLPTTVNCPATGTPGTVSWVILDEVAFGWVGGCSNGTFTYFDAFAQICNFGQFCDGLGEVNIAAGDSIRLSMAVNTVKGTTILKVVNETTKRSVTVSDSEAPSITDVQAYTQWDNQDGFSGENVSPLPSFFPYMRFGNLLFNGVTLSSLSNLTRYAMYDGTTLQMKATSITSTGSFTTVWEHS
jgi:hypothetical protein